MSVAKLKASNSPELMKLEERNDPVDTIIRQAIGKEPLLSFSRAGDSPVQWIQLLHALDQQELPGWPFSSLKVQMQKCDKCSQEFCSPINYRRHIRVHHRLRKLDKDSFKDRDLLGAFWDKLSLEEAEEVLSFKNVTLEGVPGSSIVKSLTTLVRKQGVLTLPQVYLRAGSALLDVIQARPSRFPISSQELFGILDDASEKTFLCGTVGLMQKYVFDGEAGKSGLETKNLVACTSFLVEQKLVKAWLADKDAEALRCQKLLVEEEEAAQKRKAELLEKKRKKKLRQKEHKAKEQKHGEKVDAKEGIGNTLETVPMLPAETSSLATACDSDMADPEMLPEQVPSSSEPFQHANSEEVGLGSESGYSCECTSQNVERRMVQGSGRRHVVVSRWQLPPKSQRGVSNGFLSGLNSQALKLGAMQKHGIHRDSRPAPVVNGNKIWSPKPKPEIDGEVLKARVLEEAINQPDQIKNHEVLIGSICVTLGNCSQEGNNLAKAREDCLAEHQVPKKTDIQEKPINPDSLQSGTSRSMIKLWRPVSRHGSKCPMPVQNGNVESEVDATAEKDNDQLPKDGCLRSYAVNDNNGAAKNSVKLLAESVRPENFVHAAKAFLAQRWKEAIAADHVKLVLSSASELPGCPEIENDCEVVASQPSNFHKRSILGNADNRLVNAGAYESSTTRSVKDKYKTKPEKGVKKKYIPKQSNAT